MTQKVTSLGTQRAKLGEGPLWDAASGRLYWLDIQGQRLHATDPVTGQTESRDLPGPASAVLQSSQGLAIAMGQSLHLLDEALTELTALPAGTPGRMNDGKPDPAGRFWIGTANGEGRTDCALWRFDGRQPVKVLDGVTMSNGLGWSPDASRMYYVDTGTQNLDVFDFDLASGQISNRRTLLTLPKGHLPDGLTLDQEGRIYLALWGGSGVLCLAPEGKILSRIDLPTPLATSCTFGGKGYSTLFLTSAGGGEGAKDDLAGALFKTETGAQGLAPNVWRI